MNRRPAQTGRRQNDQDPERLRGGRVKAFSSGDSGNRALIAFSYTLPLRLSVTGVTFLAWAPRLL